MPCSCTPAILWSTYAAAQDRISPICSGALALTVVSSEWIFPQACLTSQASLSRARDGKISISFKPTFSTTICLTTRQLPRPHWHRYHSGRRNSCCALGRNNARRLAFGDSRIQGVRVLADWLLRLGIFPSRSMDIHREQLSIRPDLAAERLLQPVARSSFRFGIFYWSVAVKK
jgi:hypothetical protein